MASCSPAAALKVSAAAKMTVFPSLLSRFPSLAMVVVLPPPLMPIIIMTSGVLSESLFLSPLSVISAIISASASFTPSGEPIILSLMVVLSLSMIFTVVSIPISEVISISSSSSIRSSSMDGLIISASPMRSDSLPKNPFFSFVNDIYYLSLNQLV